MEKGNIAFFGKELLVTVEHQAEMKYKHFGEKYWELGKTKLEILIFYKKIYIFGMEISVTGEHQAVIFFSLKINLRKTFIANKITVLIYFHKQISCTNIFF